MVDFRKSDKMIKITGKANKPKHIEFRSNISFFIPGKSSDLNRE